ncbi:MAG: hypothetical protein ABR555_15670 [Pyrinomonadaceae bacterium]
MIENLENWRDDLREVDAELIVLLQRRMELAVELLALLRTQPVTLGNVEHDLDRLGIFLYAEVDEQLAGLLDKSALLKIFGRVIREQKRVAEELTNTQNLG